ncbi:MAG: cytochrome ubiquinol oxidase subunit I [Desulfosarcina sp.]|nr:cytochrome ubiquinol oxidase subunit I [Desulfosarcina sp.]MBC2744990.1 cytochrome ubiquinol oxidase subunit I [Desulfosarcina sp.]MBC2767898.1 cytochrome C [Desulfosarcina sp.]
MNYPIWERTLAGGGLLIAVIAVVHVYVAHFAVGGGFFLVVTEWMGYRNKRPDIVAYVKTHSLFFLLVTMVFGAITGVGIWFTISLLSPGVTSILIHTFVFGWATEWVFFAGEIVALLLYWYRFGKISEKNHLAIGLFYVLFGWLSLFMVNGIIAFMLTPGRWLETGNFWDGFFNPSMWPSLGYRTCIALMFAGIFGFVTAVFIKDDRQRKTLVNWCVWWTVIPFILSCPFLFWYFKALSPDQQEMILRLSPELSDAVTFFVFTIPLLFIGIVVMVARSRGGVQKTAAFVVLLAGLGYMGGFEWLREGTRRPYLIYGHTYSNGIAVDQETAINEAGILKTARWVNHREISEENMLAAGREIFRLLCISCHSVGGPANDILPLTNGFGAFGMDAQLSGQGKLSGYMPRFMGTEQDRMALARFIVEALHGKKDAPPAVEIEPRPVDVSPIDPETNRYVLLVASTLGMHEFSGAPEIWSLRPSPRATIRAQLIRRDETPEHVMDGVSLTYTVSDNQGTPGEMIFSDAHMAFSAQINTLTPKDEDGRFNPYPLVTVTATEDDRILARTRITLPVTTEMGCSSCHGGNAASTGPGMNEETALNVLRAHDRRSRTALVRQVSKGMPVTCTACHESDAADAPHRLNLSSAMHGFHAVYLSGKGSEACGACHAVGNTGATRFYRGIHHEIGLECSNCHGTMADVAASLLMADSERGKPSAGRIMKWLTASPKTDAKEIAGRRPWVNLPKCLNCHVDFQPPDTDEAPLNNWSQSEAALFRSRTDDAGILCINCHGSPHALYPATNPYNLDRDNIPAFQFQGSPYPIGSDGGCRVCHTAVMEETIHHFDASAAFRNTR